MTRTAGTSGPMALAAPGMVPTRLEKWRLAEPKGIGPLCQSSRQSRGSRLRAATTSHALSSGASREKRPEVSIQWVSALVPAKAGER